MWWELEVEGRDGGRGKRTGKQRERGREGRREVGRCRERGREGENLFLQDSFEQRYPQNISDVLLHPWPTEFKEIPSSWFLLTHLNRGFLKFLSLPPMVLFHPPNEISCLVWKLQALFREKWIGFDCACEQELGPNSVSAPDLLCRVVTTRSSRGALSNAADNSHLRIFNSEFKLVKIV